MEKIRIEQHSFVGLLWFAGWLFTLGLLHLHFWKGVLAILVWPYYLGVTFGSLPTLGQPSAALSCQRVATGAPRSRAPLCLAMNPSDSNTGDPARVTIADAAVMGLAKASYERCRAAPAFFPTFYRAFLATCPEAAPLFAHTDFAKQNKLLRHAVGLLLIFPNQPPGEPTLLSRLAERHSRRDLNIDPTLYAPFIDSLIATVRQFDPDFTPATEAAWRATVRLGVEYMKAKY